MARTEARVSVEIWAPGSDFAELTPEAQWMYFFLLSQPDLAHDGVLALRERRWARCARGLTVEQIGDYLIELEQSRKVVVDEDTEELLIRSFIRGDKVFRQPNVLRAAADHLPLVASTRIRLALREELLRVQELNMPEGSRPIIAGMLEAIGEPSEMPTRNPSRNPSADPSGMPTPGTPGERGVVTAIGSGFPDPRSSGSPDPEKPTSSSSSAVAAPRADGGETERTRRATRLPMSFEVTPEMRTWAAQRCPSVDIDLETEKFGNYWRGKSGRDATKLDWPATWRNWMLNALGRTPINGARASPAASRPGYTGPYREDPAQPRVYTAEGL